MKILIVDDERMQRRIVEKTLNRIGYDVVPVNNSDTAWQHIEDEGIRFVITDWEMPDINGVQLIQKIRTAELPRYIYIILLTSKDKVDDVVEGLLAGADDYLTKPFDPRELEARVAVGERLLTLEDNLVTARNQLEQLAMVDSLTGLMNRRAIYKFGRAELERARRESTALSVIFLDVDKFKSVNDQYGHLTGEEVLKAISQTILERSRSYDGIGRWAGDEFLVILPGVSAVNAEKATKRILDGISALNLALPDGSLLQISASAGIASLARVTASATVLDDVIQYSDEALYRAKEAGGNRSELVQL